MPQNLEISQIFIPNIKQATNFVALYEERVNPKEPANLFLVMEIRGEKKSPASKKQEEFEKLAQIIARNLKRTYLSEPSISEMIFEKALTAINNELSALAARGMVGWYKKFNGLIAVVAKRELSLSTTGSASAMLLRGKQFTNIAESLSPGDKPHPLKTFANFAYGALTEDDAVILSTLNLYNFISLEKLRLYLEKQTLPQASKDIITTLKQDASGQDAFATFIFKVRSRLNLSDEEIHPLISPINHTIIEDENRKVMLSTSWQRAGQIVLYLLQSLWQFLIWLAKNLYVLIKYLILRIVDSGRAGKLKFERSRAKETAVNKSVKKSYSSKKTFFVIFLIVVALLAINLIFFNFRNSQTQTRNQIQQQLKETSQQVDAAEASLIYGDDNRAITTASDAQNKLVAIERSNFFPTESKQLKDRIEKILNQANKIRDVPNVEKIGQFSRTPDQLMKTSDGFIGFNSFTDSFEKFDQQTGKIKSMDMSVPVPENLVAGIFAPAGPVFMGTTGIFYQLSITASSTRLAAASTLSTTTPAQLNLAGMKSYSGHVYTVDKGRSQILRSTQNASRFSELQSWTKNSYDFSGAQDLAVDGNVYVLFPNTVKKFTSGKEQTFNLPIFASPLKNAKRIITDATFKYIYIMEPDDSRIIILTKQGTLAVQLKSDKFSDLKDIWVDESGKMMYVLNGNDLFRFKY